MKPNRIWKINENNPNNPNATQTISTSLYRMCWVTERTLLHRPLHAFGKASKFFRKLLEIVRRRSDDIDTVCAPWNRWNTPKLNLSLKFFADKHKRKAANKGFRWTLNWWVSRTVCRVSARTLSRMFRCCLITANRIFYLKFEKRAVSGSDSAKRRPLRREKQLCRRLFVISNSSLKS